MSSFLPIFAKKQRLVGNFLDLFWQLFLTTNFLSTFSMLCITWHHVVLLFHTDLANLNSILFCFSVPKTFCHVDGRRFRRGRVFVTKNCTLKCRCRKNGVPRCAPLCKTKRNVPVCGPDERLTEILDLFAGGRCSCETKTCIRKSSKCANVSL